MCINTPLAFVTKKDFLGSKSDEVTNRTLEFACGRAFFQKEVVRNAAVFGGRRSVLIRINRIIDDWMTDAKTTKSDRNENFKDMGVDTYQHPPSGSPSALRRALHCAGRIPRDIPRRRAAN